MREQRRRRAAASYVVSSRERLRANMESKIRTTMIGSLSKIESKLGFLWGQGKSRCDLTEDEVEMAVLKDELRTEILNHGNNQIRAAASEIDQYDVVWNRYQYSIKADTQDRGEAPAEGTEENE